MSDTALRWLAFGILKCQRRAAEESEMDTLVADMQVARTLGGLGGLCLIGTSAVVGLRLCWRGRHDVRSPESLLGLSFAAGGLIAFPLSVASSLPDIPPATRVLVAAIAQLGVWILVATQSIFVWSVFRRQSSLARLAMLVLVAAPAALLLAQLLTSDFAAYVLQSEGPYRYIHLVMLSAYSWCAFESLRYYGLMRSRQRIGLASPEVTNRFLLWGIGRTASSITVAWMAFASLVQQTSPLADLWYIAMAGFLGVVSGVTLWLAFTPPGFYRRWITSAANGVAA